MTFMRYIAFRRQTLIKHQAKLVLMHRWIPTDDDQRASAIWWLCLIPVGTRQSNDEHLQVDSFQETRCSRHLRCYRGMAWFLGL